MSSKTKNRDDGAKLVRVINTGAYASVPRVKGKPKEGFVEIYKKAKRGGESENGA